MASMFPYFYTPIYSTSTGTLAFGDGESNPRSGNTNHGCIKKYAFNGVVSHHGLKKSFGEGDLDFPEMTKKSELRRRLSGEHSWIGNLAHDLFEDSLFAMADRLKGNPGAKSQEELVANMWKRFDFEWNRSLHLDEQEFTNHLKTKQSGADQWAWLQRHATEVLKGKYIKEKDNERNYNLFRETLADSADFIAEHLSEMIEHTPYDRWAIIEGKKLSNGDVIGEEGQTQSELRSQNLKPSFDVLVDGVQVRVYCTIDFAYWLPDGRLCVADLKSGKIKESHFKQTSLYGFYITEMNPEISPEQIKFRLMYPTADPHYKEGVFDREQLEKTREDTAKRIKRLMDLFIPLDDPALQSTDTLSALLDIYPKRDAEAIWTLGQYKRSQEWPDRLPAGYSDKTAPDKVAVLDFLLTKLSPYEFTRGFESNASTALELAEAVADTMENRSNTSNQWINEKLLNKFVPELSVDKFMESFSVNHIRLAIPERFPATGAEFVPEYCRNCVFIDLCEEGQNTLSSKKK